MRGLTEAHKEKFLEEIAGGATVTAAARATGKKSASGYYRLRETDEKFASDWDAAREAGIDLAEDEVRRRGFEGVEEPVYQAGKQVGSVRKFSDRLLLAWLAARRPQVWGRRAHLTLTGADGGPVEVSQSVDEAVERFSASVVSLAAVRAARDAASNAG